MNHCKVWEKGFLTPAASAVTSSKVPLHLRPTHRITTVMYPSLAGAGNVRRLCARKSPLCAPPSCRRSAVRSVQPAPTLSRRQHQCSASKRQRQVGIGIPMQCASRRRSVSLQSATAAIRTSLQAYHTGRRHDQHYSMFRSICFMSDLSARCFDLQREQTAAPKQTDDRAAAADPEDDELTSIPDAARFQGEPDFWEGEGWEVRRRHQYL